MANSDVFKKEFERLAIGGFIGNSQGKLAYAYIRVSDSDQAEDGRSGLPRQIQHIHEIAYKEGYRISWELIFADDFTGFEFEQRPSLLRLRAEYKSGQPRAYAVVIEHLDRLSRNADWHQGFLLDELKRFGMVVVFWKSFSSRVERTVLGAIAQDGMEQAKERMMEGNLSKARSGRITARVAAYGYKIVDSQGNEGQTAKKESYYIPHPVEAIVIQNIFNDVIAGISMRVIAGKLEKAGVRPPKKYRHWEGTQIRLFIKNEIYKGDFYAHRWHHTTVQKTGKDGISVRTVKCKIERPQEEWIYVKVPAIVSLDVWEAANRMLQKNKESARRNAKNPYLLTGLVTCACCGWKYRGVTRTTHKGKPRKTMYRGYSCPSYSVRPTYVGRDIVCKNGSILCSVLESVVWNIVCRALLEPQILLDALDSDATSERNRQLKEQIQYLERDIAAKESEDEMLFNAYLAGAFDAQEFADRRKLLKTQKLTLLSEAEKLRSQVLTKEQLDGRKNHILLLSKRIRELDIPIDPPFDLKQRILKTVIDQVTLNVSEGWLTVEGAIRGTFPIVNIPVDTDSYLPQG